MLKELKKIKILRMGNKKKKKLLNFIIISKFSDIFFFHIIF